MSKRNLLVESEAYRAIVGFFDDFNEAFKTFDGDRVASKFSFPFLARQGDGRTSVYSDRPQLARYFQNYLDDYREQGCVACRYDELQIVMLGVETAVASVCWTLLDASMATVLSWHESYLLAVGSGMPTAFATIDHVEST